MTNVMILLLRSFLLVAMFVCPCWPAEDTTPAGEMLLVVGAGGTDEYTEIFRGWADQWLSIAKQANLDCLEISGKGDKSNRDQLQEEISNRLQGETPLWLVFLGHGTHDRNLAKFNLSGPDVSAIELKEWLGDCQRPLIAVQGFSCSGAFMRHLSGKDRVVITATNSGAELNYSRFGGYLAQSLDDKEADLDHDEQVSLLEAFLLASSKVARFYESESRLATEHALLEDNQDGKGTSGDFFVGIRAEGKSKDGSSLDGRLAHRYIIVPSKNAPQLSPEQLQRRDQIENEIEALRLKKKSMSEDAYYSDLERLMVELARLYASTDSVDAETGDVELLR